MAGFELLPRRDYAGLLGFDVIAPIGTIAGLLVVGAVLDWPPWWVSVCSTLVLLTVAGAAMNVWWFRRHAVTFGTDDNHRGLRVAAAGICATVLAAAAILAYTCWVAADHRDGGDAPQAAQAATEISVAAGNISPGDPNATADRAATMMAPEQASALREKIGRTAAELAARDVTVQAQPLFAGVEELTRHTARAVVVLQSIQTEAGVPDRKSVVPVRVWLAKRDGRWLVTEMAPVHIG